MQAIDFLRKGSYAPDILLTCGKHFHDPFISLRGGGGGVGPIRKFEITKGVIRSRISKKERQHIDQTTKDKKTNNDLQNIYIKLKIKKHETH